MTMGYSLVLMNFSDGGSLVGSLVDEFNGEMAME